MTKEFTIKLSDEVAKQVEAAGALTGDRSERIIEEGVLNFLESIDTVLYDDPDIEYPEGIELGNLRELHQEALADE